MKTTSKRDNYFILALDDETAEKLRALAEENDHAPSKQAFLIIKRALESEKATK